MTEQHRGGRAPSFDHIAQVELGDTDLDFGINFPGNGLSILKGDGQGYLKPVAP